MNINLVIAFVLVVVAQILAYFQLQGQFIFPWFKKNPMLISLFGFPISYLLIKYTEFSVQGFNGQTWPGRLIGFAVGAIVFAILSHYLFKEEFTLKTIVSLGLAATILLIQIFWK